jgi:2-polyprenyl-3-methyl-5-hydroxy-6-metoxy-1,4-benzoquinol methylase
MKTKDHFAHKSKSWDMSSRRVKNAKSIAESIIRNITLDRDMELMDFGAGTGLLSYFISPHVARITAVDSSPSMLEQFAEKRSEFACETESILIDLEQHTLERKFDGIISSMTIHHIKDVGALFSKFYEMLKPGAFFAIADLDSEDGTFHSDDTGVFHHGFERKFLESEAGRAGFAHVNFETVSTIEKPNRDFTVFLMTAFRQ